MNEHRHGAGLARMHGTPDRDKAMSAAARFMKKSITARKKAKKAVKA